MRKSSDSAGFSVAASEHGVQAHISERALRIIGRSVSWLFPRRDAKVKVMRALADRAVRRIQQENDLDMHDRNLVELLLGKKEMGQRANPAKFSNPEKRLR